jgi:serine/threonine-protein kinase
VPPNSVAVIDVDTNRVVDSIPVETGPGPVAAGAGFVWVGNLDDKSLTRIDPVTKEAVPKRLDATPYAVTADRTAVWVVDGRLGTLYRVEPKSLIVSDPELLWERSFGFKGAGVDLGEGAVWAAGGGATLARWDPATRDGGSYPSTAAGPTALVFAYGSVWVAAAGGEVQQFNPETYDLGDVSTTRVGRAPSGIAGGAGAVWVACHDDGVVWRIGTGFDSSRKDIPVGHRPTAIAFGAGAAWVANAGDGTVSRIDPETNEVKTIQVGNAPAGIAVSGGRVWVSVQALSP